MSHGYTTAVHLNAPQGHSSAFDHAWNPYTTADEEWVHYSSTEINENLPDFDESVLEQFIHENEAAMMSPDSQMHEASSARSPLAEQVIVSSPSHTQSSGAVPVCTPYPGEFGFAVTLEKQAKKTKSANWIYYPDLHKLFVKINKPCPFLFKTAKRPPSDAVIRALPVFLNPEHIQEVVRRCPTHRAARNAGEAPTALTQHMILSEHQMARHVEDAYTHRLSVVTPYEDPQAGAEWVTSLYRFMCFSSCHSGYSRRPLHVVFTLECHGQVLGRQVIKVRCCASPGRDGCQEEESLLGGGGGGGGGKRPSRRKAALPEDAVMPDAKRQRAGGGGGGGGGGADEIFTIQVRGRENYETLRRLRDSLELVEQLPPEVVAHFRWQQMEQDRWSTPDELQQNPDEVQRLTLTPLTPPAPPPAPPPPLLSALAAPSSDKTKKPRAPSDSNAALGFSVSAVVGQTPMYF